MNVANREVAASSICGEALHARHLDIFEHAEIPRPPLTGRHVGVLGVGFCLRKVVLDHKTIFRSRPLLGFQELLLLWKVDQ
ncbi:hypothetical protein HBN88_07200 [Pseudomonas fragi]|nr:hypothetical protein [Pseudomonas fragi]